MYDSVITQRSRAFYEQFPFPGTRPMDKDGLVFVRKFSASMEERARKKKGSRVRVLDAGCGTGNTSIALARAFRNVEFVGIDQSFPSLEKARRSAHEEGVTNISFLKHDLMDGTPFTEPFDAVLCLGVLHHLADMKRGLQHLCAALDREGDLYVWIYGKHGRYIHSLNMRCLRMLIGAEESPTEALTLAREFVEKTDQGSALRQLLGETAVTDLQLSAFTDPVWIADQFLNPHEVLIDMEGVLELVRESGLEICERIGEHNEVARRLNSPRLYERFQLLDERQQLIAADLLFKPEWYFLRLRMPTKGRA